jgi:hypothetical protein
MRVGRCFTVGGEMQFFLLCPEWLKCIRQPSSSICVAKSELININPSLPTRHIIARVSNVLSGLATLYERQSELYNR